MKIYFYKNNFKHGGWTPFSLDKEDGKKWNLFCQMLMLNRKEDPSPYYEDYLRFLKELNTENV